MPSQPHISERNRLRKEKRLTSNFWQSNVGKLLLVVPKNLLKVTIATVAGAFCLMLYIISTDTPIFEESDLEELMRDPSHRNVHPLYTFM